MSGKLFDELDKDTILNIYTFLSRHRSTLHLSEEILDMIRDIVVKKYDNVEVYKLNPSINDLLSNNVYKLYINEELFLVPLWHTEMYFDDTLGNDIIVICRPELSEHISIDENNNIHYNLLVPFEKDMIINQSLKDDLIINIGKRDFKIPLNKLYIKEEQIYTLKGQGITKIIEDDVYNVSCKCDIIVKVTFI